MSAITKDNNSILLFNSHQLIKQKQTITKENAPTIREKQRKNRNTELQEKHTPTCIEMNYLIKLPYS